MDEFAQTCAPDDLFADDFEPIAEPITQGKPTQVRNPQQQNIRGSRGRGPRRGAGGGRSAPRQTTDAASFQQQDTVLSGTLAAVPISSMTPNAPAEVAPATTTRAANTDTDTTTAPPAATTKPIATTPAVRGDRTATGGLAKPKLSETELATRMEAIKLKNVSLTAAHERASADEASFQAREEQAQERRRLDRQNRQQMMGEREKNRARKLQAVGGREWDAEKGDTMPGDRDRGSGFRRGAFGGVVGGRAEVEPITDTPDGDFDGSRYEEDGARRGGYGHRGRGGGERGAGRGSGRGGRGGGRGGRGGFDSASGPPRQQKPVQTVPGDHDFPSLPSAPPKPNRGAHAELQKPEKGPSWAEEMEDATVA